jgi:hypothetical protein
MSDEPKKLIDLNKILQEKEPSPEVQGFRDAIEKNIAEMPEWYKNDLKLNKAAKKVADGINEILDLYHTTVSAGFKASVYGPDGELSELAWLNSAMARIYDEYTEPEHQEIVEQFLNQFTNE